MQEVMDCYDFNQLQPNESQDQCGFASVALCFAAGPPGKGPRQPVQWAIQQMASWYTEYNGPDILSNTRGMDLPSLYKLIVEKGGHYQAIDANATSVAHWIAAKYPVIVAVVEGSVYDVHLKACPYTWNVDGLSHIFTVTGIENGHIFLCRDTVNQRDGSPYSYDGDKLSYLSATVFVPDWMPRPTSSTPPVQVAPSAPDVPTGWKDANEILTAPNDISVIKGFRSHVLSNHWNASNWPLEPERETDQLEGSNPNLGKGVQQTFRWSLLGYTVARGVFEEWLGVELVFARAQIFKYYTLAKEMHDTAQQLQADNTKLQADLQAFQKALPQQ